MTMTFMSSPSLLMTSESVTEGHPDKVCDQIADAILDDIIAHDPDAHVACEVTATTGLVLVLGALGWSYGARQLRSQTLSLRRRDFLEAAVVRGERKSYVIVREILPTMTSLILASFLGAALYAVLFAACSSSGSATRTASAGGRCSTGPRTTRRSGRACRTGRSCRASASLCWGRRSRS